MDDVCSQCGGPADDSDIMGDRYICVPCLDAMFDAQERREEACYD